MNRICDIPSNSGHAGRVTLPARKRLNHRGPLSIDMSSAWYFITICADGHAPWVADEVKIGRAVAPRPPDGNAGRAVAPRPPDGNAGRAVAPRPPDGNAGRAVAPRPPDRNAGRAVAPRPPPPTTSLEAIAPLILREARENHNRGIWWLALFLVMPDHLHFIVNIGGRGATALPDGGTSAVCTIWPPLPTRFLRHASSRRCALRRGIRLHPRQPRSQGTVRRPRQLAAFNCIQP